MIEAASRSLRARAAARTSTAVGSKVSTRADGGNGRFDRHAFENFSDASAQGRSSTRGGSEPRVGTGSQNARPRMRSAENTHRVASGHPLIRDLPAPEANE